MLLVLFAPAARAAPTWGLTWRAPADCLQAAELAERVERRMGQPLFVASAPRAVEGRLEQMSDQWRARFTIVDVNGKILGTRELEQSAASCRDLDERLVFLVVLLIRPMVELEARPPPIPSQPGPPPPPPVRLPPARERTAVPWVLLGSAVVVGAAGGVTLGVSMRAGEEYALSPPDTMGSVRELLLMQQRDFLTGAIALFTVAGVIAVTSLVIFILESR